MTPIKFLPVHPSPTDHGIATHVFSADRAMGVPITYLPQDILDQEKEGICTDIALIQNVKKATGVHYSEEHHYWCQKKRDGNTTEGSSIWQSATSAKLDGLVLKERVEVLFPEGIASLRKLPYPQYWDRINTVLSAASLKSDWYLPGFAPVNVLSEGIANSVAGIICRYEVSNKWWTAADGTVSWDPSKIDPIGPPDANHPVVSGHAINVIDASMVTGHTYVANTWGPEWNIGGCGNVGYLPTEAWILYYTLPVESAFPTDLRRGDRSDYVSKLQTFLVKLGYLKTQPTGLYGKDTSAAILSFQRNNGIQLSWYERYIISGTVCGPKTRAALNNQYHV